METKIPAHQWVDINGEVLVLRFCSADGIAYGGFQHPMEIGETVEAPDWRPDAKCGGGVHGWPWGIGLGEGKDLDWGALWQVYAVKPDMIVGEVEGGQKCKFKIGSLRHKGDWQSAMFFVLGGQKAWVEHFADGAASATGDKSAASATGYKSAASATGDKSAASATGYKSAASATGYKSAASATGYKSAASATGDNSAASATGYKSAASATGDNSAASATGDKSAASATLAALATGTESRARAGKYGCIALAFWNTSAKRIEMRCKEVGGGDGSDGKLKADTWYRLSETGGFVEATD